MLAQVWQTFWAKKPCKKSAHLHPRQGNLLHWDILQGSTKPLFTTQNRVEISWKKICPFFQHARSISRFLWFQHIKIIFSKTIFVPMTSLFEHTNNAYLVDRRQQHLLWLSKNIIPWNAEWTRVFCSWGECDAHCAKPPEQHNFLRNSQAFRFMNCSLRSLK
jgi:hypothetical protein